MECCWNPLCLSHQLLQKHCVSSKDHVELLWDLHRCLKPEVICANGCGSRFRIMFREYRSATMIIFLDISDSYRSI